MGFGQYTGHDSEKDRGYPDTAEAVRNARTSYIRKADQLADESEEITWSRKWGGTGVKYRTASGRIVFKLYDTRIVVVRPNGDVELNTGGWYTQTTRGNMEAACKELFAKSEYGFPVAVWGDKGNPDGRNKVIVKRVGEEDFRMNFEDGIVIPADLLPEVNPIWEG